MKKMMVLLLALCMMMTAAGAMAETFDAKLKLQDGYAETTVEARLIPGDEIKFNSNGNGVGYGAHAANQMIVDIVNRNEADYNGYMSASTHKYFTLTLPQNESDGNYQVYIPNTVYEECDIAGVYVSYSTLQNGKWIGTELDKKKYDDFHTYVGDNNDRGVCITVPMTGGQPIVFGIVYKRAGGNVGGGNDDIIIPGGPGVLMPKPAGGAAAAADMPQTGDASMLGAWIALLGASGMGLKLRRKK